MMRDSDLDRTTNKAWGCLMGVAAGDAMGMPSSFLTRERIGRDYGWISEFLPAPEGHAQHAGLMAGQVTDDTQQTICLARTIIDRGDIEPAAFARALVSWAKNAGVFGVERGIVGPTTRIALKEIDRGKDLKQIGRYGKTNGAVMRISPIGILNTFGNRTLEEIMKDVEKACLPTHWTNLAIAGAGAVASIIAAFLNGADLDAATSRAREAIRIGLDMGTPATGSSLLRRLDLALEIVRNQGCTAEVQRELCDVIGNELPVYETVPFCIALMHLTEGKPMEAIELAANLGGDADTTASIVGAMCGANAGIEAFPDRVCQTIERVNRLGLRKIAVDLLEVSRRRSSLRESPEP